VSVQIGMLWMKEQFCVMFEFLENILILHCTQCKCSYRRCPTDGFNYQVASMRH